MGQGGERGDKFIFFMMRIMVKKDNKKESNWLAKDKYFEIHRFCIFLFYDTFV